MTITIPTAMRSLLTLCCSLLIVLHACTPTTTSETTSTTTTVTTEKPMTSDDRCAKFADSKMGEQAIDNYIIYRDFLKNNDTTSAFPYWQKVYEIAPAADGQRKAVYEDGITFFHQQFTSASADGDKRAAIDQVMDLYDHMGECYTDSHITGRKAFDYYYKYRDYTTDLEILALFEQEMKDSGNEVPAFVVNPYTGLMTELFLTEQLSLERAQAAQRAISEAINYNLQNCKDAECDAWNIVNSYAPGRLESLEAIKGFYDCTYFKEKYLAEWEANPTDCDLARSMLGRLNYAGCEESDADVQRLLTTLKENCRTTNATLSLAYDQLQGGSYQEAIASFLQAASETDDLEKKSRYTFLAAKIYYAHLKDFPSARKYALEAASYREGWGEPYILIGKLYASSGPLCGPGRGFDSQVVVWVAIDKWNYAKRIDPSVAEEARQNIARYAQYMPTRGDIFERLLNEGDTYYVGCWIRENTTIRVKK